MRGFITALVCIGLLALVGCGEDPIDDSGKDAAVDTPDVELIPVPKCQGDTRGLVRLVAKGAAPLEDWSEASSESDGPIILRPDARFYGDEVIINWVEPASENQAGGTYLTRYQADGVQTAAPVRVLGPQAVRFATNGDQSLLVYQSDKNVYSVLINAQFQASPPARMNDLKVGDWDVNATNPIVFALGGEGFAVFWNDRRMEDESQPGQHYFEYAVYLGLIWLSDGGAPSPNSPFRPGRLVGLYRTMSIDGAEALLYDLDANPGPSGLGSNYRISIVGLNDASETILATTNTSNDADFLDYAGQGEHHWAVWVGGTKCPNEVRGMSRKADTPFSGEPIKLAEKGCFAGSRIIRTSAEKYVVWVETTNSKIKKTSRFSLRSLEDLDSAPSNLDVTLSGTFRDIQDYRLAGDKVEVLSVRMHGGEAAVDITTLCLP